MSAGGESGTELRSLWAWGLLWLQHCPPYLLSQERQLWESDIPESCALTAVEAELKALLARGFLASSQEGARLGPIEEQILALRLLDLEMEGYRAAAFRLLVSHGISPTQAATWVCTSWGDEPLLPHGRSISALFLDTVEFPLIFPEEDAEGLRLELETHPQAEEVLWRLLLLAEADRPAAAAGLPLWEMMQAARRARGGDGVRLSDTEVELFLLQLRGDRGARGMQGAARILAAAAGMTAEEALGAVRAWQVAEMVLPNGQWLTERDLHRAYTLGAMPIYKLRHGLSISSSTMQTVQTLLAQGQKIGAIKALREVTGSGLREAKEAVEAILEGEVAQRVRRQRKPEGASLRSAGRVLLDQAIDALLMDFPLHWVILSGARIREDANHPTMAVGFSEHGELFLFFNPVFVREIGEQERQGVLLHEINHVLFGHLRSPHDVEQHRVAWMCACECTANEYIPRPLPGEPITLASLKLPPRQSTDERYTLLRKRTLPTLLEDGCGGLIGERLRIDARHHGDVVVAGGRNLLSGELMVRQAAELVGGEIDPATLEMLSTAARGASWVEHLRPEGLGDLPWDALLRRLARQCQERYATRRFPSRRQPELVGIVPGHRTRREVVRILVAIDTSGSMSDAELAQIAAELRGLVRQQQTHITCLQCDTEIREERTVQADFSLFTVKGRGGTDLRPPFAEERLRRLRPDLLVYFTDGEGPAPSSPPPNVSVLWVLTGAAPRIPAPFGAVVCMRPRSQRRRVR